MAVDVDTDRRTAALKALAEPARWRIVERLASEELCVCHLVEDLGLAQPLVSHHLKVLREAGLVEAERYRQWTYHRLVADALAETAAEVTALRRSATRAVQRRPCC
jgi:ArsR family transcriptional regulator, arsenate/arsenite/antimonite-responsive transcriptional repressor